MQAEILFEIGCWTFEGNSWIKRELGVLGSTPQHIDTPTTHLISELLPQGTTVQIQIRQDDIGVPPPNSGSGGAGYFELGQLIQILASPEVRAGLNIVTLATLATNVVALLRKHLFNHRILASKRVAEALCVANAMRLLKEADIELVRTIEIPPERASQSENKDVVTPPLAGLGHLEGYTYIVVLRDRRKGGVVLNYTIRSDLEILSVVHINTDYAKWSKTTDTTGQEMDVNSQVSNPPDSEHKALATSRRRGRGQKKR